MPGRPARQASPRSGTVKEGTGRWTVTSSGAANRADARGTPAIPGGAGPPAGTTPIESDDSYAADGIFESDDEVEEFIAFTHAARQAETA